MIIRKLTKTIPNIEEFRGYCQSLVDLMKPSFSRYTDRRLQLWLFNEVNLGNGKVTPGYFDNRLYEFCQQVYPGCDVGLLCYHGKRNGGSSGIIRPHGDHQYARPIAVNINLGIAEFSIGNKLYKLNDGDIVEFNCKQPHSVPHILSEERFSLVLWQLNQAKGYRSTIDFPITW